MSVDGVAVDRDGVLMELWREPDLGIVDSALRPDQVRLAAGAADAVRALNAAGLPVVVVSNQPGVAKGKHTGQLLDAVTAALVHLLAQEDARIEHIFYCVHHPDAVDARLRRRCPHRKPEPGMLLRVVDELGWRPAHSWFVGDTHVDVQAGRAAGFRTAWIGKVRCDVCPCRSTTVPDVVATDVVGAVRSVLSRKAGTC